MKGGKKEKKKKVREQLEDPGIDPGTSRMLSERSTIWANPPDIHLTNESDTLHTYSPPEWLEQRPHWSEV